MSKRAVLIGNNYTGTSAALNGCHNDVETMKAVLEKEGVACHVLLEATGTQIREALTKLAKEAVAGDFLVVHYSGHGTNVFDRDGDEKDRRDECICPVDYTKGLITDDELRAMLVDPLPEGCTLYAVLDCCHSGSALDLRYMFRPGRGTPQKSENVAKTKAQVFLISGCRDDQTSADAWEDGKYQGAMTCSLKYAIGSGPLTNANLLQVLRKMRRFLRAKRYPQVPQLSSGRKVRLRPRAAPKWFV